MKKEWQKYKIEKPSNKEIKDPSSCKFSILRHVSHINNAINIIRNGELKPGLIFDKSQLNKDRILVNWLSPNYWQDGFRYGNVSFDFKIDNIIEDKRIYWIESIKSYSPIACRFLITENDYSKLFKIYNPSKSDGPWWYDVENNNHYYNGKYCMEFMFEQSLSINDEVKISFVQHHKQYCSENRNDPGSCKEIGMSKNLASKLFLSKLIASSLKINKNFFTKEKSLQPNDELMHGWCCYMSSFAKYNDRFCGKLKYNSFGAKAMARAISNAYGNQLPEKELIALVNYFKSYDDFMKASAKLFAKTFGIKNWKIIYGN